MGQNQLNGKFLYGIFNNTCIIKAVGNLNFRLGGSFDCFITRVLADNSIDDFLIDLTETEYIDSTNLGLLARIQVFSSARFSKQPTVISTNENVTNILKNVGFDRLFTIIHTLSVPQELDEVPECNTDEIAVGDVMLSAHRYLMHTSKKNEIVFKEIVHLLETEKSRRQEPN